MILSLHGSGFVDVPASDHNEGANLIRTAMKRNRQAQTHATRHEPAKLYE